MHYRFPQVFALWVTASAIVVGAGLSGLAGGSIALAANGHGNDNGANDGGGNGNGGNGGGNNRDVADAGAVDAGGPGASGSAPGHNKTDANSNSTVSTNASGGDIGALHAVKADLQAFIHASPKSEVGQLAAYAKATIAVENAQTTETAAVAAFDTSLATFKATYTYSDYSIETLEVRLEDLTVLATMTTLSTAQQGEVSALNAALSSQQALALIAAQTAVAVDEAVATGALATAANKLVDASVQTYVDSELEADGVLPYYRSH